MRKIKILLNETILASLSLTEMQELRLLRDNLPQNLDAEGMSEIDKKACEDYNKFIQFLATKKGSKDLNITETFQTIQF